MSLLSPNYVDHIVSQNDLIIASLAWGFTLGFGWLTTWTACKQTRQAYKRHGWSIRRNAYIWMIWSEILVCLLFSIICWLRLKRIIPASFCFYFAILTLWALQVQFLLQIIINRCSVILPDPTRARQLKIGVAVVITAINISVYIIWIPARLQISPRYLWINEWWDRIEKALYLMIDGALNLYFIRTVQNNLVSNGVEKYRSLVRFNKFIICFSLSMDVLIIAMMSLDNTFVYMQFHPLAYIVKLNIEMSMAELIVKVAKSGKEGSQGAESFVNSYCSQGTSTTRIASRGTISSHGEKRPKHREFNSTDSCVKFVTGLSNFTNDRDQLDHGIHTTREVHVEFENAPRLLDSWDIADHVRVDIENHERDNTTQGGLVHIWNERNFLPGAPSGRLCNGRGIIR